LIMNGKNTTKINLDGLTLEQIEQIQVIIDNFKQQNKQESTFSQDETKSECDSINGIFFESEIIQPFNRAQLYGNRI
ncbi:MAG: hypothetical protein AAGA80_27915, partial [Cyanobacteria bacterium P01_F01_bin.143]